MFYNHEHAVVLLAKLNAVIVRLKLVYRQKKSLRQNAQDSKTYKITEIIS